MGAKLKIGEGATSIVVGQAIYNIGQQLVNSGEQLVGWSLIAVGAILIVINLIVFADGLSDLISYKLSLQLKEKRRK